jgi:hypothetical protein
VAAILATVRRALATALISLGLLSASLALAAWWVQRTAFDTSNTAAIADAALLNPGLRGDLARGIADQVSTALGVDHALVESAADATLVQPDIATAFAGVLRNIHARLIGEASGPITVPPDLVARAIGNDAAAQLPPVTIDIPTFSALNTARRTLRSAIPWLVFVAITTTVMGLAFHPSKPTALRILGGWLLGASIAELIIAYTIPVLAVPALVDSPYAELVAEVDKATLGPLVGVLVMLAGAGVGCLVLGAWLDRREPTYRDRFQTAPYRW